MDAKSAHFASKIICDVNMASFDDLLFVRQSASVIHWCDDWLKPLRNLFEMSDFRTHDGLLPERSRMSFVPR